MGSNTVSADPESPEASGPAIKWFNWELGVDDNICLREQQLLIRALTS